MGEPSATSDLVEIRTNKLLALRDKGIDPFPARYRRSHTNREASALLSELETTGTVESSPEISLAGRVTAARHMG
ncbi:MAG: lysine--tRNA ligase, partial [Chloroflexi bacterium]|nr:lysine--tRNA ligase [Chloroflexota bacterium]